MGEVSKENGKKVCVTGASGYIASWLVKLLLQRGYTVHATVRDLSDPTKTEHLMALEGAQERLKLFKANLMEEGSFDGAIDGCEGVFHTASPVVVFSAKDTEADVIDPAINGTLNVLASCKKFPTVRRVILTSTTGTSLFNGRTLTPDVVVDETWFSDPEMCKGSDTMYYVLSKVLAEEAAWKFVKENDMDMVTINPSMTIGPMLQPTMNDSVASILNLINGTEFYPDLACPWVHVKDVAEAHIRAFEIPSAKGRYILGEKVLHFSDVLKILHEFYPSLKLPHKIVDVAPLPNTRYQVSNTKVRSLGIEYIPFEVCLKETIESLEEKKFVQFENDPDEVEHLKKLDGAKERLHLFEAELLEEGSFDSAISGCHGVFHVASPVNFNVIDPQVEVLDPAVKGTINVLNACKRVATVKRVVLTSSIAAVLFAGLPVAPGVVVDETWFSKPEFCNQYPNMKWYSISKLLAEEAAWKFAKENDLGLVTINPGMVIGPMLPPKPNETMAIIFNMINEAQPYPNMALPWVHIHNVAEAHTRAFELPSATGRYCLVESVVHQSKLVELLNELYPSIRLPNKCADDGPLAEIYQVSKAKAESLGIQYISLRDNLKDAVESLKEKKLINAALL